MARFRTAEWQPVERYQSGSLKVPLTKHRAVVIHIEDSDWDHNEAFGWYNTSGHATPQFRFDTNHTRTIKQYIDSDYCGTATLHGNPTVIAIECRGLGRGDNAVKMDARSVRKMAEFLAECHNRHGIPLRMMFTSLPRAEGVAPHRRGIDGNFPQPPGKLLGGRVENGEKWSLSGGKTCPTSPWIIQMDDEIIPLAIELVNKENALTPDDKQWIQDQIAAAEKRASDKAWTIARSVFRNNIRRVSAFIDRTWEKPSPDAE